MAGRDPTRPQLEFPQLVAELITQLRLTGQVGRLNFSDEVIPAFLIGSRGINFGGDLPSFNSAAVFDGSRSLPPANHVLIDTGALPQGTYDLLANFGYAGALALNDGTLSLQHRNAANSATLAVLASVVIDDEIHADHVELRLIGYEMGLNERFRVIGPTSNMNRGGITGSVFARIRPTP